MVDVTPIVAALDKSGFPLQTRVEHEIKARGFRGWRVIASEHPWRDPDGHDQFIDLIACCGTVLLVIECKKSQERSLLFLRPLGADDTGFVKNVACWHIEQPQGAGKLFGVAPYDLTMEPGSYQSQFCVSTDKEGKTQRLLEQDARPVVLAADAIKGHSFGAPLPSRYFVVPVIVTTAAFFTLRYAPTEVSLDAGGFTNLDPKNIEPISWVRFHKTLTAEPGNRPRTVFVVNSGALTQFLDNISAWQGLGPPVR
jgi:hypothetical protein